MLFWKKREQGELYGSELRDLETSVQVVRGRLKDQQMPLADLFAMMGEDDRPILNALSERRRQEGEAEKVQAAEERENRRQA